MPDSAGAADPGPFGKIVPVPAGVAVEDGSGFAAAAGDMLIHESGDLGLPDLKVQSVDQFLGGAPADLTVDQKLLIVKQAILLFDQLYPHLPFKKRLYKFAHPVETLREMEALLQQSDMDDADFHAQMIVACCFVVDAHTLYGLPDYYRGAVAFLPFQLRPYRDQDNFDRYVVTRVMKTPDGFPPHPLFVPGAEVTHWNGSTTDFYVQNSRGRTPGGNFRAVISRGSVFATIRPLAFCQAPDERVATLHYIPPGSSQTFAISLPWAVATGLGSRNGLPNATFSVSESTHATSRADQIMVHREDIMEQRRAASSLGLGPFLVQPGALAVSGPAVDLQQISKLPTVFDFQYTEGAARPGAMNPQMLRDPGRDDARFGYIRIRNFGGPSTGTKEMVDEFQRILRDVMNQKAPDGLVLDLRGNPGGDVIAAERMLQMLTARRIAPANFHLANTPAIRGLLQLLRQERDNPGALSTNDEVDLNNALAELAPWVDDPEGASFSPELTLPHTLTKVEEANDIGQVYHGRCSLIIDALSYSAADIFSAGFQDHAIGPILGVDTNTGGGGANVWTHEDLQGKLPVSLGLLPLPPGVTLTLAFRRCSRVGVRSGSAVEDVGVIADVQHDPASPGDVLDGFQNIVRMACRTMGAARDFEIIVRKCQLGAGVVHVEFDVVHIEFVRFTIDSLNAGTAAVQPGVRQIFDLPVIKGDETPGELTIQGYAALPAGKGTTEWVLVSTNGPQFIRTPA